VEGPGVRDRAVNGTGCRDLVWKLQDWLDAHPACRRSRRVRRTAATPNRPRSGRCAAGATDGPALRSEGRAAMTSPVASAAASSSRSARASSPTRAAASITPPSRAGPRRSPRWPARARRSCWCRRGDRRGHQAPRLDVAPVVDARAPGRGGRGPDGADPGLRARVRRTRSHDRPDPADARGPRRPATLPQRALDADDADRPVGDRDHHENDTVTTDEIKSATTTPSARWSPISSTPTCWCC